MVLKRLVKVAVRPITFLALSTIAAAQPPAIAPHGIVNAASLMPPNLPGGKIAVGARILISGVRLVEPNSKTMIVLDQGNWHASIAPTTQKESLLEATLPANTPLGTVEVSVVNAQGTSRLHPITVVASSPAIFTLNGEGWGPVGGSFRPGQSVTIRVDSLNEKRAKLFVAGAEARIKHRDGESLTFAVPNKAPAGCWTPIWIQSETGSLSNFGTISIERPNGCEQASGWPALPRRPQSQNLLVVIERLQGAAEFNPGQVEAFGFERGVGIFFKAVAGGLTPFQVPPPSGTCTSYTGTFSFGRISEFLSTRRLIGSNDEVLDAGPALKFDDGASRKWVLRRRGSSYSGLLGGAAPFSRTHGPLLLDPGSYYVRVNGSEAIGKMDLAVDIPQPFEWLNESAVNEIDQKKGIEVLWRDTAPNRQMVVAAISVDSDTGAMGSCFCIAPAGASRMKIPAYALANFPASSTSSGFAPRFVLLASIPRAANTPSASAGLTEARAVFLDVRGKNVNFH
jgi:hypothetical protein